MVFEGQVRSRSSAVHQHAAAAPGESEIQRRNPQRVSMILNVTGWETLSAGSLNLAVNDSVIDELGTFKPKVEESAAGIVYPPPHEWIPTVRKAYWYYTATARVGEAKESVLVRRAEVPVRGVVELFAAVSLTGKFRLKPNDVVGVEVFASRRPNATSI